MENEQRSETPEFLKQIWFCSSNVFAWVSESSFKKTLKAFTFYIVAQYVSLLGSFRWYTCFSGERQIPCGKLCYGFQSHRLFTIEGQFLKVVIKEEDRGWEWLRMGENIKESGIILFCLFIFVWLRVKYLMNALLQMLLKKDFNSMLTLILHPWRATWEKN